MLAIAVIAGWFGFQFYQFLSEGIPEMYAQWWVAGMVVTHLETKEGKWPRSWDDLREPYEIACARDGRPWKFEDLRRRVDVDFDVDPSELEAASRNATSPPFRVIRLRSGRTHHWESAEPNEIIFRYFKERQAEREAAGGSQSDRDNAPESETD